VAVVPVPVTSRDCVSPFAVKLTLVLAAAVNGGARRRPNSPAATFGEPATSPTPRTENFTDSVTRRTPITGECQFLSLEPADIGGARTRRPLPNGLCYTVRFSMEDTVSEQDNIRIVHEALEAWNKHDPGRFVQLLERRSKSLSSSLRTSPP